MIFAIFVWTLKDVFGAIVLGILLLLAGIAGAALAWGMFLDWCESKKRWWNRRK